ncbi:MAG: ABC transporter permease [Planctomycetes bacterium]|nr:ABC transporter permease [Planctomycetota bacterium]
MSSSADGQSRGARLAARHLPTFVRWLGNFGWPILLRQLRADFRKNRFFFSQFVCLGVLGVTLIAMISYQTSDETRTATQIGQALFDSFFIIQYLIILVIFPAFSATAFTEERAGLTIDLLLASTLKPEEIVWGKFFASTVYCLVYVVASIPLLSISFLFGGVEPREVLVAYGILIGLTLLISMVGVCISSWYGSPIRSTLTVYVLVFLGLAASWYAFRRTGWGEKGAEGRTLISLLLDSLGVGSSVGLPQVAVLAAVAFAYLFLITANRVRPSSDDRTSPLRALTFIAILGFLLASVASPQDIYLWLTTGTGGVWGRGRGPGWQRGLVQQVFVLVLLAAAIFPTEEAATSRRNRARFGAWTGPRYPLRIFAPGAFWGFAYAVALTALSSGVLLLGLGAGRQDGIDGAAVQALLTMPFYIAAVAALGFLLAACDFTPFYARLTVSFVLVITALLPFIFMLSKEREEVWTGWDVLWRAYYLSPLTLWQSLVADPAEDPSQFLLFGVPVAAAARWILGGLGAAFLAAGVLAARRAGHPLLRFAGGGDARAPRAAQRA